MQFTFTKLGGEVLQVLLENSGIRLPALSPTHIDPTQDCRYKALDLRAAKRANVCRTVLEGQ